MDDRERVTAGTGPAPRRSISFLVPRLDTGGAERQLVGLAAALHDAGWRVLVLTFRGGGALWSDLAARGVEVVSLDKGGRWDLIGFTGRLVRAIRRERPAIVHGYLLMPNLFTVLVRPFAPRFRAVWGVRASNMDQRQYGLGASVAFWVSCRLSRFADLIICNSVSGKAFHAAHGFPPSRMVVIPNGIDVERFSPRPVAREAVRAEWGITAEQTLVGLVARLDPMKDHPTFLRAAQRVAADRPSVRFVCVGSGPAPYRAELERLATELDLGERVIWAGNRTDVAEVYNALDLLVSSSQWGEGLSNVVAEAMATGIPCVVTDVGDSRLLVGETGWLCPPADPASVASAIGAALGSAPDRARRGREARARIVDEYAVARLQEATARELSRLVDPA